MARKQKTSKQKDDMNPLSAAIETRLINTPSNLTINIPPEASNGSVNSDNGSNAGNDVGDTEAIPIPQTKVTLSPFYK